MRFLRFLLALIVALAAVYGILSVLASPRPEHPYARRLPSGVAVLAHQGGDGLWPSNTLLSFLGASALGADVLELDVHEASDGTFVVIHDDSVDRTTEASGPVAQRSAAELQALDAGYRWTVEVGGTLSPAPGAVFPYRGAGATIPTLAGVLAAFPEASVNIEIKPNDEGVARRLCTFLQNQGATGRVMVGSFHVAPLRAFRQACPTVATSAAQNEVIVFLALEKLRLSAIYTPPFEALQVPISAMGIRVLTPHFVKAAHARGLDVHVWTIDDSQTMRELLELGVDGIISDRPDRAMQVLGRPLPAGLVPGFVVP